MTHRIDFYKATIAKVGGAMKTSYTASATQESVPCMVQPAEPEVADEYGKRNEMVSHSIFTLSKALFDAIGTEDRIVYNSVKYRYKGKKNLSGLNRVFRIDVIEEQV